MDFHEDNVSDLVPEASDLAELAREYAEYETEETTNENSMLVEQQSDDFRSTTLPLQPSIEGSSLTGSGHEAGIEGSSLTSSGHEAGINKNAVHIRKPHKKSSKLWQYFIDSPDGKISCTLCRTQYSKTTGISTIKTHFQTHHPEQLDALTQQTMCPSEPYGQRDREKVDKLSTLLVEWIICDQQPFYVVDNPRFRALVKALDERYQMPVRQTVANKVTQLYEAEKTTIKRALQGLDRKIAITTDMWTACTNQAYMSVTLHWIDDDWQLRRILLDLIPTHERHTGQNLKDAMMNVVRFFGIGKQILSVTTDNASNMDTFERALRASLRDEFENTEFCRVRCAAHILNLMVKQGLSSACESVTKARQFASHIRNSQKRFEALKKIFIMKDKPFLTPQTDVPTRWNSTYLMIARLREIREMTDILVVSDQALKSMYLEEAEWQQLDVSQRRDFVTMLKTNRIFFQSLVEILEPIYQATNVLSSSTHPTMGDFCCPFSKLGRS